MFVYKLFLWLYPIIAKIISPFHAKAKEWCRGQKTIWNELVQLQKKVNQPIIWIHCASYGEFEQGLPIIESLKSTYPSYQIWLTFFSPSGYLYRKDDPNVDIVSYMPIDSPQHANAFLDLVQPTLIVFIKYEFWYYYLENARKRNIPTLLVSAIFREDQIFFKTYGGFFRKILNLFTGILVQDETSKRLIQPLLRNKTKLEITGDNRFDRVFSYSKKADPIDWITQLSSHKCVIAGSTWQEDHIVLAKTIPQFDQLNWIIVPHQVDKISIEAAQKNLKTAITLTRFLSEKKTYSNPIVLIIDSIGLLRSLYQYAYIAYIGGGLGRDGVHNVLEPAAYAKPVIWGNNDKKYREAIGLREAGGGFRIENASMLEAILSVLVENKEKYKTAAENARQFVVNHCGATEKTIQFIQENRLLTN